MIPLRETIGSSDETVPRIDNNVVDGTVTTPMGLSKLEMRMREMRERFNRLASLDDQVDDHPSGAVGTLTSEIGESDVKDMCAHLLSCFIPVV